MIEKPVCFVSQKKVNANDFVSFYISYLAYSIFRCQCTGAPILVLQGTTALFLTTLFTAVLSI